MAKKDVFTPKKEWWKSKTIWASTASLLVVVLTAMYGETSTTVAVAVAILSTLGIYGRAVANTKVQ